MNYWIVGDVCADLPRAYAAKQDRLMLLPMSYTVGQQEYLYGVGDEDKSAAFYGRLRGGEKASTSQISTDTYYNVFRDIVMKGEGVLCLPLSGGISGSVQNALMAQKQLKEKHPEAEIEVLDSLCASLGIGLLIDHAIENRAKGMSLRENAAWVEDNRRRLNHWFTVDDLNHLYRGGRLSRGSAVLGSVLRIKPVLRVDAEGRLVAFEKVQGRKRSIRALADMAKDRARPEQGSKVFISHGDVPEDAEHLAGLIREELPFVSEILISPIGAVIGAHSGPGTVAVFFMGEER